MKVKNATVKVLMANLTLLWGMNAQAEQRLSGVGSSGGGKAIVCRDANYNITSATLLDLYEAVHIKNIKLDSPLGNLEAEYERYLSELRYISDDSRPVTESEILEFKTQFKRYFRFLPAGFHPEETGDSRTQVWPAPGCAIEQVAHFRDDLKFADIDTEIWNHLDSLNKVALWAHETFYSMYRTIAGEDNSRNVRDLVGHIFAEGLAPKEKSGVPSSSLICYYNGKNETYFHVYPDENHGAFIQFDRIFGRHTYSPMRAHIPQLINGDSLKLVSISENSVGSIVVDTNARMTYETVFPLEGVILKGFKVGLDFQFNRLFKIAIFDSSDRLVDEVTISGCINRD